MGIITTTKNAYFDLIFQNYLNMFTNVKVLKLFLSIGTFVWMDIVMLMVALLRKDKIGIISATPILLVVLSLLVATPVFSEFRYIYAVFCALPVVVLISLRPTTEIEKETDSLPIT